MMSGIWIQITSLVMLTVVGVATPAWGEVVYDNLGAALGQCQRMCSAESLPRARDNGNLAIEIDTHGVSSVSL